MIQLSSSNLGMPVRLPLASLLLASVFALISACGGGSSSGGDDDGGGGGGPVGSRSCQEAFDPDKIGAGEDCTPVAGEFCPTIHYSGEPAPSGASIPCEGVQITEHEVTVDGFADPIRYLAIRPSSGQPESMYLQLHYLNGKIEVHANQLRLTELAKARNVLIIVPQAPPLGSSLPLPGTIVIPDLGGLLDLPGIPGLPLNGFLPDLSGVDLVTPDLGSVGASFRRWPNNYQLEPVEEFVGLLDGVVADARSRFSAGSLPLYVGGYSNGAAMSYFYGCARPGEVAAIITVGANMAKSLSDDCPALPAVIMGGTNDAIAPYGGLVPNSDGLLPEIPLPSGLGAIPLDGILGDLIADPVAGPPEIYADFKTENGCTGADRNASLPPTDDTGDRITTNFLYNESCANGTRLYLVTMVNGGHTWPAQDNDTAGLNFSLFGAIARNWDATIYGYDLMKLAAGN